MDVSPQDVGQLLRLAPFAIAVLAWLWKRARSKASPPSAPRTRLGSGRLARDSSPLPPDAGRFTSAGRIEPR